VTLVIDASVAVKWVLPEVGSEAANQLKGQDLAAPDLWLSEAANALWRRSRRGEFSAAQANQLIAELLEAPVVSSPIEADIAEALKIARDLGHPVYDCLYLACALRYDTRVVTGDIRFAAVAARSPAYAARVVMLGAEGVSPPARS